MNTSAPTPVQIDVMVMDLYFFAMEERVALQVNAPRAASDWREKRLDAQKRLIQLTVEFGEPLPGRRKLSGECCGAEVQLSSLHALNIFYRLTADDLPGDSG